MRPEVVRLLTALIYAAAAVGGGWLALRFLLPWAAPFLLALALAALMEPAVRFLTRHGWPRSAAAGLLTLSGLALLIRALAALANRAVSAVTGFVGQVPALMDALARTLDTLESRFSSLLAVAPEGAADYLLAALDGAAKTLYGLPAALSQGALDFLGRAAQSSGDVMLFAVTAGIGTYFFSAGYPRVTAFLWAQLPRQTAQRLEGLGQDVKSSFGAMLRAQLILMAMTFFELLLAFFLLDIPDAAGPAALTALVDALPVFGTGTVLVPWALYRLLLGDVGRGVGLLICWVLVNLVRSCVQAKLLGDQIGLDPLASLLAIYVGWRICGVLGMLLFPVLLVTLQQLNDKGVVHLWRSA